MDNPLKIPILELLNELELPVSEFELIQQLKRKLHPFPRLAENHSVELFRINFLVMNALYQLQQQLLQEKVYLSISPLAITLQPLPPMNPDERALSNQLDCSLSEYFLDWTHFEETGEQEVDALFQQFWNRFLNTEVIENAYHTLAINPQSSWTDIQKAYRKQALLHHPDKGGQTSRFIEIRQAYEVLKTNHH